MSAISMSSYQGSPPISPGGTFTQLPSCYCPKPTQHCATNFMQMERWLSAEIASCIVHWYNLCNTLQKWTYTLYTIYTVYYTAAVVLQIGHYYYCHIRSNSWSTPRAHLQLHICPVWAAPCTSAHHFSDMTMCTKRDVHISDTLQTFQWEQLYRWWKL